MTTQFRDGSWAHKIFSLGKGIFEMSGNKEMATLIGCANHGQVSNERAKVARETGWKLVGRSDTAPAATATAMQAAPKARKPAGSLPAKIEGFLTGLVDDIPDVWEPVHVYHVIEEDSVGWNRFIRRMADLDSAMVESFERWLVRGATLSRQADFDVVASVAAQWDIKAKAESLAAELVAMGYGDKTPAAMLREGWL
jgi:hypothetical protein